MEGERKSHRFGPMPSKDWVFLKFQWRPSWMLRRKSLVESTWHAVGTGQGAMLTTSASPGANCFLSFPSNDAHACPLLLKGTCTRSVTCSGNISGLKDKECGQIGVNKIPGTCKSMKLLNYDASPEGFSLIIIHLIFTTPQIWALVHNWDTSWNLSPKHNFLLFSTTSVNAEPFQPKTEITFILSLIWEIWFCTT